MKKILTLTFIFYASMVSAQKKLSSDTAVNSIDAIVRESLKLMSGKKGKARDWPAFRNLFLSTANLTAVYHSAEQGEPIETVSLEEFTHIMDTKYHNKEFIEQEIGKQVDEYNGIATVFQSFYSKDSDNKEVRGINCYQLIYSDNRWWIANLVWTDDSNGVSIPKK